MPTLDEVYRKFGEVAEAAQLLETELGMKHLCAEGMKHDLFAGRQGRIGAVMLGYRPGQADKRADANDTSEDLAQPK